MIGKFIPKIKCVKKDLLYLITYCAAYVPVTVLSPLNVFNLITPHCKPYEVDAITPQKIGKQKHREAKYLAQGHRVGYDRAGI